MISFGVPVYVCKSETQRQQQIPGNQRPQGGKIYTRIYPFEITRISSIIFLSPFVVLGTVFKVFLMHFHRVPMDSLQHLALRYEI